MSKNGKHDEIFTSTYLVQMMCDRAEPLVSDINKKVLDPGCGTGNFLIEVVNRRLSKVAQDPTKILIALSNVYGIDIRADFVCEARHRIKELIFSRCENTLGNYRFLPLVDLFLEQNLIIGDYIGNPKDLQFACWDMIAPFDFVGRNYTIDEIISKA